MHIISTFLLLQFLLQKSLFGRFNHFFGIFCNPSIQEWIRSKLNRFTLVNLSFDHSSLHIKVINTHIGHLVFFALNQVVHFVLLFRVQLHSLLLHLNPLVLGWVIKVIFVSKLLYHFLWKGFHGPELGIVALLFPCGTVVD